jgi:hypothetical protein
MTKKEFRKNKRLRLQRMLDRFLEDESPVENNGWAKVTSGDLQEISEIFHTILVLKFERDCDGDLPVEFDLTDRTCCERRHCYPLPYHHKASTEEELDDIISTAAANAKVASERLDLLLRLRKYELERIRKSSGTGHPSGTGCRCREKSDWEGGPR